DASRALDLEVMGPQRIRLEVRALAGSDFAGSRSWLHLREGESVSHLPLEGPLPSSRLKVIGRPELEIGRRRIVERSVGSGARRIRVSAEGSDALVRIESCRSRLARGILPPRGAATVQAALDGALFDRRARGGGDRASRILASQADSSSRLLPGPEDSSAPRQAPASRGAAPESRAETGAPSPAILAWRRLERAWGEPLLPLPPGDRLRSLVYIAPRRADLRRAALILAEHLMETEAVGSEARSDFESFFSGEWEIFENVHGGGGARTVEGDGWQPITETGRLIEALAGGVRAGEKLISDRREVLIEVEGGRGSELILRLENLSLEGRPTEPIVVLLREEEGAPRRILLSAGEPVKEVRLELARDATRLRAWLAERSRNHYLRLSVRGGQRGGAPPPAATIRRPAPEGKRYFVATRDRPLRIEASGPEMFRIEEIAGDEEAARSAFVFGTGETIELSPPEGRSEALFRIYRLTGWSEREEESGAQGAVPRAGGPAGFRAPRGGEGAPLEPGGSLAPPFDAPSAPAPGERLLAPPGGWLADSPLEDPAGTGDIALRWLPTFSLSGRFVRTRATEEDIDGNLLADEYLEYSAAMRLSDDRRELFSRTLVLGRERVDAGPTIGLRQMLAWRAGALDGLELRADGSLLWQWPEGDTLDFSGDPERSATLRLGMEKRIRITSDLHHEPSVEIFVRDLSVERGSPLERFVTDPEVFTRYKASHLHGLVISETVRYRPWVDAGLSARASLVTNERLDPFAPDHFRVAAEWEQIWGSLECGVGAAGRFFFSDGDRRRAYENVSIAAKARKDFWLDGGNRLELRGDLEYDITRSQVSFSAGLVLHFSGPRLLGDFSPDEVSFRGERVREALGIR
ncbi:MAG: hypothetical protein JXA90_01645, partial [Planctomycetes bacterium]|nr:hypothetical protein [Planctomycetota bacterium]